MECLPLEIPLKAGPTRDEAVWFLGSLARVVFCQARCKVTMTLAKDPQVRFPHTVGEVRRALQDIQRAMQDLLHKLPQPTHETVAWLFLNGTVAIYEICEPLATLGYGRQTIEFLVFAAMVMDNVVTLSACRYLRWRLRLYTAICFSYEDQGKLESAKSLVAHAKDQVAQLRALEENDPPIPSRVERQLKEAENDLGILYLKYAIADASQPIPGVETGALEGPRPACSLVGSRTGLCFCLPFWTLLLLLITFLSSAVPLCTLHRTRARTPFLSHVQ